MTELTSIEQATLREFLAKPGPVREALGKFGRQRQRELETQAADCLRVLPRQIEQACDAAAKAEAYGSLMRELERYANQR